MTIAENVIHFNNLLQGGKIKLVAISKTKTTDEILEAYHAGQRDFGENKVQELTQKSELLPKDIQWHMVGHLQGNKVKYIAPFIHLIHSADSLHLLREINKQGGKAGRIISCLLQVYIAEEETKFGFDEKELFNLLNSGTVQQLENIEIKGLMGMATFTPDEKKIRSEFRKLKNIWDLCREQFQSEKISMDYLSMGMSGDYSIALEEGSNMIRIGTAIFGERNYHE